jgi:phage recombination protein Bet
VHIVPMQVSTGRKDSDGWDIKEWRDIVMQGVGLYRTKAARTGQYAGCDDPEFGPDVTEKLDGFEITYPKWCRFTVYRMVAGQRVAFKAMEFWKENYATKSGKSAAPNAMWKKRPAGQLSKCAEAQALRRGFPDAVGSAPTVEEMEGKAFDFDVDSSTGEISTSPGATTLTPQRKSAAPPPPADDHVEDVPFTESKAETTPAKETAKTGNINAGQVKYLTQKFAAVGLEGDAILGVLAKHGANALDTTISAESFDAIKAELLAAL